MKKKTMLIIGILGIILILGAAVALAQNASSEKTKDAENHECTPEMMEDMSKNCPEQMMQSSECENMMDGEIGHSGMMEGSTTSGNAEAGEGEHCGDMGSDMDSMMGSKDIDKKGMM
ncbi:MAG: hypothetical protein PHH85_05690 [Candidatus Methanoperedens sp.]|nr:hypothetical protein [Candidatus Methanoperedens sp.]